MGEELKMKKALLFAMLFCLAACDESPNGPQNTESSSSSSIVASSNSVYYGGQRYRTVKIGEQTWFAENLNYAVEGSKCYGEGGEIFVGYGIFVNSDNDTIPVPIMETLSPDKVQDNCTKYGRLYDWATAIAVCPPGWHLPSRADWEALSDYVQDDSGCSSSCNAEKLKATSGWNDINGKSGNGTDEYGFSALPGGGMDSESMIFSGVDRIGRWWSAEALNSDYAYCRIMTQEEGQGAYWWYADKPHLYSVRCLQE